MVVGSRWSANDIKGQREDRGRAGQDTFKFRVKSLGPGTAHEAIHPRLDLWVTTNQCGKVRDT